MYYKGELACETEGAPRTFTFSHSRYTEGYNVRIPSDNRIHKDQTKPQFAYPHNTRYGDCANYACKVFCIPEILERKSCKEKSVEMPQKQIKAPAFIRPVTHYAQKKLHPGPVANFSLASQSAYVRIPDTASDAGTSLSAVLSNAMDADGADARPHSVAGTEQFPIVSIGLTESLLATHTSRNTGFARARSAESFAGSESTSNMSDVE